MTTATTELTDIDVKILNSIHSKNGRNGPVTASDIDDAFAAIRGQGSDVIANLERLGLIETTASPLPAGNKKHYKTTELASAYIA